MSFPIGIGREGYETPLGVTKIVRKKKYPVWYPGPSAHADDPTLAAAVKPGPDNPLGTRALYLAIHSYLIHGTNLPYGVGRRSSRGCVRLYNGDVEKLFELVPVGTPVRILSETVKLGWFRGDLYMEVHPTLDQATQLEDTGAFTPDPKLPPIDARIQTAVGTQLDRVDWGLVRKAVAEALGIPSRITRPSKLRDPGTVAGTLPEIAPAVRSAR
jgi:L,D-transpeptidase ErfK/SrfK